jgi:outer membrane protein TolC
VYKLRPVPFTDGGAQVVTLDELLELALNNSAALKQQGNAIEKSRFVVDQTYYSYDPDLSAALGFGRQSSAGGAGLGGAGGSSGDSYSSSFGVTKPFEYGDTLGFKYDLSRGKSGAGTAASSVGYGAGYSFSYARPLLRGAGKYINRIPRFIASNNAQLACGKLDDNVRKLKQSVIDAFYRAVAARQGIEVRQSALELALKQLDRSVERYKAGLAIEADVLQSENAVLTQRSALLSAGSGYKALLDQLTTLVGLPQEYALAVDADGALLDLGGELPEDLWDLVQANSYDLKSLNTSLANARLSLDQQMNQLKPNVGLSLSYGRSGADTGIGHALTGYESDNLQVGLNWSGKRGERAAKAGVAQSELDLASLQLQIQDAELQLKSAVRGLQRDLETKYEQIGLAQSNLDVLQKTYDIMSERNSAGLATALDVIEAQEGVLGGQLALLQAQVAYHETYRSLLVMAGLL